MRGGLLGPNSKYLVRPRARQLRVKITYHRRKARALRELRLRRVIVGHAARGMAPKDIAARLGVGVGVVTGRLEQSMQLAADAAAYDRDHGRGAYRANAGYGRPPPRTGPRATADHARNPDDVLDPPSITDLRKQAFELRLRAIPLDEIADMLGISENRAREYVAEVARTLAGDELHDADAARRIQLAQLDQMIRAIHAPATGRKPDGSLGAPVLEAIDRMLKLLDRKSKLLGLDAPQRIDISQRLEVIAHEGGYDYAELEEIAMRVLRERSLGTVRKDR